MIKERLSSHYLYHQDQLIKRARVEIDDNGCVVSVIDPEGVTVELASMRYLNGILIPLKENSTLVLNKYIKQVEEHLDNVGEIAVLTFIERFMHNNLDSIMPGKTISFGLLKGVDYQTMQMKLPVRIIPVKWLH